MTGITWKWGNLGDPIFKLVSKHDPGFYSAANYKSFTKIEISETPLPKLFDLFHTWTKSHLTNLNLENLGQLCGMKNNYMLTLERLYGYYKSIHNLNWYKNTKEYLLCALVYNEVLWIKILKIMVKASGYLVTKIIDTGIISMLESEEPSDNKKKTIIRYLTRIKKIAHNKDLYFKMDMGQQLQIC